MFPKVGDVVKLNPNFSKLVNRGKYFKKEDLNKKFTVTKIEKTKIENLLNDKSIFKIYFESKYFKYGLFILSNGELYVSPLFHESYKGMQVFIPANIETNDLYCSCGGPKKESYVLGKKFYICTICKKEKLVKILDC